MDPYLVARVDQMAKASGVSRNAALALGVSWLIRRLRESDAHWNG
ncbi:CopG family transcriptional regulator [Burkholderia cenocepacia]|nr:CopG family transcriptional regulator [Burkholderia cenocepacia]